MNNIFVLNKNYRKIGTLSNQGANPQAPYFNDLYVQDLETGADTYEFNTISSKYTQDLLEIGNHIMFAYKNRNELFTITSIEYSHSEGYKTIGVYAESVGFELLEVYMEKPAIKNYPGNDSDGDGDDNTDDEYADVDDIYIDENGNIIYDKDGSGPPSEDDVTIDGNGNIIYKPSRRKDGSGDSLEFKNISYPTFLKMMLKDNDWSYVCQPGLESNKKDMRISYDKNIFAILQDSMQTYRGVELEFRYEYDNGKVTKTVYAYNDGGRGSFVGKRFEYGTNVKGITKMQEVANSEDDTILYVDNVGIEIRYDVDFALRSSEVSEIEIGDTHYVIDKDFYPPMQITARIGKIEISFADPTRNKIYLANNKKIRGSGIEDDIDDSDYDDDIVDDGGDGGDYPDDDYLPYHTHSFLKDDSYNRYVYFEDSALYPSNDWYDLGKESTPWDFAYTKNIRNKDEVTSPRFTGYNYHVRYDRGEMKDVVKITNSGNITKQDLLNFIIHDLNVYEYDVTELYEIRNKDVDDSNAYFNKKYFGILSDDVYSSSGKISRVGNKVQAPVVIYDTNNDGDVNADDDGKYHAYNIPALLSCLIGAFQYHVSGGEPTGPTNKDQNDDGYDGGGGSKPGNGDDLDDPSNPGGGGSTDLSKYVTIQYLSNYYTNTADLQTNYATKTYVDNAIEGITGGGSGGGSTPSNPDSGGSNPGSGNVFDTITVRKIQGPDPGEGQGNVVIFEDGICVSHISCAPEDENDTIFIGDHVALHGTMTVFEDIELEEGGAIVFPDGSRLTSANGSGSSTDNITASKIVIGAPTDNKASKCSLAVKGNTLIEGTLYVEGSYYLNGTPNSDKSLKENIRYIDNTGTIVVDKENLETRDYSKEELLEITDLHDFIVNQINICEYNFINNDRDKIGFIANDYEGTKVGDKIVFRNEETDLLGYDSNNLLFATIGALQEEVRIKDEKIASLEDRLAKIEAMLGINNNDN